MAWENRDYNRYGGDGGGGGYLGNPLAIANFSVPFGTWFGARVRLHFWLLLQILFNYIGAFPHFAWATVMSAMLIVVLLLHEFGHRIVVRRMDGDHDEFMLWPLGGMVPPRVRPGAWPMFAGFGGGIAMNLVLGMACVITLHLLGGHLTLAMLNPFEMFRGGGVAISSASPISMYVLMFMSINVGLIFINLLPYYWFDGGYLLQSILWPWTGLFRSINVTCIVGMVLAVPLFAMSLMSLDLFGMIFWALLFASSYTRRNELKAGGTGEFDEAVAYSASLRDDDAPTRKRSRPRWGQPNPKAIAKERALQMKVDAILEKVHQSGMNSLTWWERRTLRVATEKQRKRDRVRR